MCWFPSRFEYDTCNMYLQLFLMKRGGKEIYVGPLGHHSCHLIKYFEVGFFEDHNCKHPKAINLYLCCIFPNAYTFPSLLEH